MLPCAVCFHQGDFVQWGGYSLPELLLGSHERSCIVYTKYSGSRIQIFRISSYSKYVTSGVTSVFPPRVVYDVLFTRPLSSAYVSASSQQAGLQ